MVRGNNIFVAFLGVIMVSCKCKMCDSLLNFMDGETIKRCDYCGTQQVLSDLNDGVSANIDYPKSHIEGNFGSYSAEEIYDLIVNKGYTDISEILKQDNRNMNEENSNLEEMDSTSQLYQFELIGDQYEIVKCKDKSIQIAEIPSQYGGYPVTSIGNQAFSYCENLVTVIIPSSVTMIDFWAFNECLLLSNVIIPNSVTMIDDYAFEGCTSLRNIHIPASVTNICDSIFNSCLSLENITVDEQNPRYKSIDGNLYSMEGDTTVFLQYAIGKQDKSFTIPDFVTIIAPRAFVNCETLTSVSIPNSVVCVSESAFWGCAFLECVYLPSSVRSIGHMAFEGCTSLTSIKYCGTEDEWNDITKGSNWDSYTGNYTITYNYTEE